MNVLVQQIARDVDWRRVQPEDLKTPEECNEALIAIDNIIGAIDTQIREAIASYHDFGERADSTWLISAKHASKKLKIKRNAIQERKGVLSRAKRKHEQDTADRAFVTLAKDHLSPELFQRLVEEAKRIAGVTS